MRRREAENMTAAMNTAGIIMEANKRTGKRPLHQEPDVLREDSALGKNNATPAMTMNLEMNWDVEKIATIFATEICTEDLNDRPSEFRTGCGCNAPTRPRTPLFAGVQNKH